jgi:hypothetical protein
MVRPNSKASAFLLATLVCVFLAAVSEVAQRRPARPTTARTAPIDYSKFSHATAKHQAACNTCHKMPTETWKKVSTYPDTTDYPGHEACVSCHRAQFFKGGKPPVCSVCHTKTSPRDEARFEFRNPSGSRQFTIEFPHDKHQDVIASLLRPKRTRSFAFVRASFSLDDQPYNNCTICHGPRTVPLKAPASGWTDSFVPNTASFKAAPMDHASCFNCHWKSQQPVADNCKGCHKLSQPYTPSEVPTRISLKFAHEGGGEKKNHVAECSTCHINITKSASLRGLKPDVPITACTECHNKDGLRQDVSKELAAIDKNRDFVCVYCHTSNVGKLDPPASHYLIAERPAIKRKDIK